MGKSFLLLALVVGLAAFALAELDDIDPPVPTPFIWEFTGGEDMGIGAGFDFVNDRKVPGWLFNYSYNEGKTVKIGNYGFQIPDGISLGSVNRYLATNNTRLFGGFDDYWKSLTLSSSMSTAQTFNKTVLPMAFSATKAWINSVLTANGTRSFSLNGGAYLTFAMQFRGSSRPPFSEFFQMDIDDLPQTYDHDAYARFIGTWGTHYFTRAVYGCDYGFYASISNNFTGPNQRSTTTTQIDLYLRVNELEFGIKQTKAVNESSIDPTIRDAARLKVVARGGDALKLSIEKSFSDWLNSCHTSKAPLTQYNDIEPISDLIANPKVRANVIRAIVEYGKTGRLLPPSGPTPPVPGPQPGPAEDDE